MGSWASITVDIASYWDAVVYRYIVQAAELALLQRNT